MTLINKITVTSWYDTSFTTSDDANVYENYNYASANPDGVLQCVYRYFQDHERRRNLNCIYGGFQTNLADSDTDLVINKDGTADAEAMIAGRIATMDTAETLLVENGALFPADDVYYICLKLSAITETSTRDGSSGETFSWVSLTSLSAIDDTYLVVCSVEVSGTQTLFSNLVQLANPYEIESNKFRPKYDHSMSYYVGDGDSYPRILSVLMDWDYTTFYLPMKIDEIEERTGSAGVTIEDMLIKASPKIKADTDILYTNTIDDYDAGILTITPPTTITGAVIASSTINSVGDFSVNTNKMTVNATSGNSTIAGTLDVTGLVTGTAGFSGALTGNVTGNLTGDVTGNADTSTQWETTRTITMTGDVTADSVNVDGTANVTITNTVIANDSHTHIVANITNLSSVQTGITMVGTIDTGIWHGTTIDNLYLTDINQALKDTSSPSFGTVTANFVGSLDGNALTSTLATAAGKLSSAKTIALSGDVTATGVAFDGTTNITISNTVVADDSHSHSDYILKTATKYTNISIYGNVRLNTWSWINDDEYVQESTGDTSYVYCYIYLPMPHASTELEVTGHADAGVIGNAEYIFNLQYRNDDGSWTTITTQSGFEGTSGGNIIKTLTFTSISSDSGKTYRLGCGIRHSTGGGSALMRVYGARIKYSVD